MIPCGQHKRTKGFDPVTSHFASGSCTSSSQDLIFDALILVSSTRILKSGTTKDSSIAGISHKGWVTELDLKVGEGF